MTILEAKRSGACNDCIYRIVGPGPAQCISPLREDQPCPGKRSRKELQAAEEA